MSMFSNFWRRLKARRKTPGAKPNVEMLEDRSLPSVVTISGFVYQDANNNGLSDPGELPIANSSIQLKDANNVVIGNTTTDAVGFYKFDRDDTVNTNPATLTKTLVYPSTPTDFTLPGTIAQFDPALGSLQSIQVLHDGSITSNIKVENTSTTSSSTINGTVGGSLQLTGPGVDSTLTMSQNAGTFNATKADGKLDYSGSSGTDFGEKTVSGTKTTSLGSGSLAPYIGTGQVSFTEIAQASSYAAGGGNLNVQITSTGKSQVTVVYTYIPSAALKPGKYTVYQTVQPAGFFDGKESSLGVPLNHPPNTDFIEITLVGNDSVHNDFGELGPASISGFVWHDANNNAAMDGEAGIAGVLVTLTDSTGAVNFQTNTDANGLYQFKNLSPGTFTVRETQPANWLDGKDAAGSLGGTMTNDQIASIVLPSNGQSVNNNFGELKPASVSGYVYVDANNNGIKDTGEAPIAGAQVALSGGEGGNQSAATDGTGFYQFTNLAPGTYALTETQPGSYYDGKDAIGSQGGTTGNDFLSNVVLASGASGLNNNFGELSPASLSGHVFVDANNNGVRDNGEAPIAGVAIALTGSDTGNQSVATDGAGFYQFTNLKPGTTYALKEAQPGGYLDGKDSIGSQGGTTGNDLFSSIVLGSGVAGVNNDFGELAPASLSGFVYVDDNNNGIKDPGEAAIAGTSVTLSGGDAAPQSVTTDGTGFYQFGNLRPGTYALNETQPANYYDGKDTVGSQGGNAANDAFSNIILPAGVAGVNNNFGELAPASLSGYVYADANNNGVKDPGETPLGGVTVVLTGTEAVGQTVATDVNGFYQFTNLKPGAVYTLTETQPGNYYDGKDAIGSQGGTTGNDVLSNITLASGVAGVNNNFGELAPASLSGYVYADANNNGVKDPGELPIGGTNVTLTGSDSAGPVNLTTATDAAGFYQFQNLRVGTYTLSETQPANYLDGKDLVGSQGGTTGNDVLSAINLAAGVAGANNNFGELVPAGLSGFVYVDDNNNGIKEQDEVPLAGVTVTLTGFDDQGPLSVQATTDATGLYKFTQLRPGNYALTETQPANYNDGKDTIGTPGGTTANDNFSNILLAAGFLGVDNNFGEVPPDVADVGIVKTASAPTVLVGSTLTYTLTITNYGTHTARDVKVVDTLPPDVTYQNASGNGWSISYVDRTITATLPSLAVGASAVILVTVTAPPVVTTFTNTSVVSSTTPDNNPINNTSTVIVTTYNSPGQLFPKEVTPLGTSLTLIGKGQLHPDDGTMGINASLASQMAWVDGAFRTFTGRSPSLLETYNYVHSLRGGYSTTALSAILATSPEHTRVQANVMYKTYMGRAASLGELNAMSLALQNGTSEIDLAVGLLTSPEYLIAHPTPSSLVAGFYKDILSKTPDAVTQLQLVSTLANETAADFARALLTSEEGLGNMVDDVYRAVLRRPASTLELQTWVPRLQSSQITLGQLRVQLLGSAEFYTLAFNSLT